MRPLPPPLLPLLLCAVAAAAASTGGDTDYVLRQRAVVKLLEKITQGTSLHFPEHDKVLESFKWESLKDKFEIPEVLERFMYLYDNGVFLGRNKDFSITHVSHMLQLMQIYEVLYYASDFDTFWKVAVWLRYAVNERMFAHALYSVLPQRADTRRLQLPALYEVFPQYFVTSDVMQQAYDAHLRGLDAAADKPVVVRANYTGWQQAVDGDGDGDGESAVSYFREDAGLGAYWAACQYQQPGWLNASADWPPPTALHGGPRLYVLIRNLLARYDMERYSRGLPPVRQAELWEPVEGYDPQLRHQSGHSFPARPDGLKAKSTAMLALEDLMDWERRLRDGIAMSIYLDSTVQIRQLNEENAMKMIGRALRGGVDSPNGNYYGYIYYGLFTIFGRVMDPYHKYGGTPSALEIPETMTRDPLFYRILKRMWRVMDGYKREPYRKEELVVPDVKIESFKIDKLTTFFDDFEFHIDNAIEVQKSEDAIKTNVIAVQRRLNHTDFSYLLKVTSDRVMTAMVRLFLGPGEGSGEVWTGDDSRHHFYLLDAFDVQLQRGQNSVVRRSRELWLAGEEAAALRALEQRAQAPPFAAPRSPPRRLLLPRGRPAGLPATLVAVLTDSRGRRAPGHDFTDGRDPFFPMDRSFYLWELAAAPNAHVQQVRIFHRGDQQLDDSEQ